MDVTINFRVLACVVWWLSPIEEVQVQTLLPLRRFDNKTTVLFSKIIINSNNNNNTNNKNSIRMLLKIIRHGEFFFSIISRFAIKAKILKGSNSFNQTACWHGLFPSEPFLSNPILMLHTCQLYNYTHLH